MNAKQSDQEAFPGSAIGWQRRRRQSRETVLFGCVIIRLPLSQGCCWNPRIMAAQPIGCKLDSPREFASASRATMVWSSGSKPEERSREKRPASATRRGAFEEFLSCFSISPLTVAAHEREAGDCNWRMGSTSPDNQLYVFSTGAKLGLTGVI